MIFTAYFCMSYKGSIGFKQCLLKPNRLRDLTITAVARGQCPLRASWAYAPFHDACSFYLGSRLHDHPSPAESMNERFPFIVFLVELGAWCQR